MATWRSATGRPLSSEDWLEAHHEAKLHERQRFAESLVRYKPTRIVDIGCGTGLWFELLDQVMPATCEFIGIDSDPQSLAAAQARSTRWDRPCELLVADVEQEPDAIPDADLVLAFNMLPYLPGADWLINELVARGRLQRLVVRQYDGSTIRLGPMSTEDRSVIDSSLYAALGPSNEFGHYEMDHAFTLVDDNNLRPERVEFELTQRIAPFPTSFMRFFEATISWMSSLLSEDAQERLEQNAAEWQPGRPGGAYFAQVDLVAILST